MDLRKKSLGKSSLCAVLSAILPDDCQTQLLRVCLLSDGVGRRSWENWLKCIGQQDPLTYLVQENNEVKNLMPLLFHAINKNTISVHPSLLTLLRTAYFREELRHGAYQEIFKKVLSTFSQSRVEFILLKGSSLAYSVYENPIHRHCHDIDILLKDPDPSRALSSLMEQGFSLPTKTNIDDWENIHLTHKSGLPLVLHRHLFRIPFHNTHSKDFWEHSMVHPIANIPTLVLSPSDNLFHICGHAFCGGSRLSLRWVSDSWSIINHHQNLDWDRLLFNTQKSHLGLQVSIILDYLAKQLDACIPESVLTGFHDTARQSATIGYETALYGLRDSGKGGFRYLFKRGKTWRAKAFILKWMFCPSSAYMRWVQQVSSSWSLPLFYAFRPLKYIISRVWSSLGGYSYNKVYRRNVRTL